MTKCALTRPPFASGTKTYSFMETCQDDATVMCGGPWTQYGCDPVTRACVLQRPGRGTYPDSQSCRCAFSVVPLNAAHIADDLALSNGTVEYKPNTGSANNGGYSSFIYQGFIEQLFVKYVAGPIQTHILEIVVPAPPRPVSSYAMPPAPPLLPWVYVWFTVQPNFSTSFDIAVNPNVTRESDKKTITSDIANGGPNGLAMSRQSPDGVTTIRLTLNDKESWGDGGYTTTGSFVVNMVAFSSVDGLTLDDVQDFYRAPGTDPQVPASSNHLNGTRFERAYVGNRAMLHH